MVLSKRRGCLISLAGAVASKCLSCRCQAAAGSRETGLGRKRWKPAHSSIFLCRKPKREGLVLLFPTLCWVGGMLLAGSPQWPK